MKKISIGDGVPPGDRQAVLPAKSKKWRKVREWEA